MASRKLSHSDHAGVRIPVLGTRVGAPARGTIAWYAGVGALTAFEVIEWPLALVIAAGHALATHSKNPELKGAGEAGEAGA